MRIKDHWGPTFCSSTFEMNLIIMDKSTVRQRRSEDVCLRFICKCHFQIPSLILKDLSSIRIICCNITLMMYYYEILLMLYHM